MKLVSIIVPIYNVEKHLRKCLDSLINQTLKEIEIILINDGSKDNSLEICLEYAKQDSRIKVIDKVNEGVSIARNTGIELAEGDYIGFVDPDDWIEPEMYESMYLKVRNSIYSICICNYYKDTKSSSSPKVFKFREAVLQQKESLTREEVEEYIVPPMVGMDDILPKTNSYIMGCVWRCLYAREFIEKHQLRFEKGITIMEDLVFNVEALLKSNGICIDEGIWYHYVQHNTSALHAYNKSMWPDQMRVHQLLEKHVREAGLEEEMRNRLDMRYIGMAFSAIYNEVNRGSDNNIRERLSEVMTICKDEKFKVSLERAKPLQAPKKIDQLKVMLKSGKVKDRVTKKSKTKIRSRKIIKAQQDTRTKL